jgi:sulfate permease, SulP family
MTGGREVVASLVTPIAIIAKLFSFALLIFSGALLDLLPVGIGYCLVGAAVATIVFAWRSELPFAIAVPESKSVAVLAALAAVVSADVAHGPAASLGPTVVAALLAASVFVGAASWLFGVMKLGRLIRFTPYPIIGGFMAASGWILLSGSLRVLLREPLALRLIAHPPPPEIVAQALIAVIFALAVRAVRKITQPLAFPALLLAVAAAINLALRLRGVSVGQGQQSGWLVAVPDAVALPAPWLLNSLSEVNVAAIVDAPAEFVAVTLVVLATLLLSLMAIEVGTGAEVDLDHELKVNGLANVAAGLCGGMVSTISANRTLFHYKMGARARASAAAAGLLCLTPMLVSPSILGLVPAPLLAGLLLQMGGELIEEWLLSSRRTMQRSEYAQLVLIFFAIVFFDFVAGVGLGLVVACITFAINTSRVQLVLAAMNRKNYASRVDRPIGQAEALAQHGENIQILRLQGFIFFGSAYGLLSEAKQALERTSCGNCRSLVLDCRRVLGIDSSAVLNLVKLRSFARRGSITLAFSGLSAGILDSLKAGGVIEEHDPLCRVFPTLEAAIEWGEGRLIRCVAMSESAGLTDLSKAWLIESLGAYCERIEPAPGALLFEAGEAGDSLYFLASGRAGVVLRTTGGEVRLRTMLAPALIGEMGLYREAPRGAAVRVDETVVVYRLSFAAMERMERENPALAIAFHKFVIRTMSSRLEFANREVAALDA